VPQGVLKICESTPSSVQATALPTTVFRALTALCDIVVPADEISGSASDAGVPHFLDYVASQSKAHFQRIVSFVMWLNAYCDKRYGIAFVECSPAQQEEVTNQIAYRKNTQLAPELLAGIEAFRPIRRDILNAFYTSRVGIEDLGFRGNQVLQEFSGCPIDMTPYIEALRARDAKPGVKKDPPWQR